MGTACNGQIHTKMSDRHWTLQDVSSEHSFTGEQW